MSSSDFYFYLIMKREDQLNYILLYRSLINQFLVDMYVKIDIWNIQNKLRSEIYVHQP